MAALGAHGAATVYVADDDALAQSLPQPMVDAIAGVLEAHPHDIVLLSASVLASDVGAALAARLGTRPDRGHDRAARRGRPAGHAPARARATPCSRTARSPASAA